MSLFQRTPADTRTNFISPETRALGYTTAAMGLSAHNFMQMISKAEKRCSRRALTRNPHSVDFGTNRKRVCIFLRVGKTRRRSIYSADRLTDMTYQPASQSNSTQLKAGKWSSIITLVVSCPVSEILQVFCWKQQPTPFHPNFGGVPLGLNCLC